MKKVHFLPWVGENFKAPKVLQSKVLVLGESHYTEEDANDHNLTTKCVNHFQVHQHHPNRFFDMVSTCLLGFSSTKDVSNEERIKIWNDVVFYNFIQESVNDAPRGQRTKAQWENGKEPFLEVIEALKPDLVIAFGYGVAQHLPDTNLIWSQEQDFREYSLSNDKIVYQGAVKHPAGGLSYSEFHRVFKIGLELVENKARA